MEKDDIGADYNDYLTLIKINGQWTVIAKVYHRFEALGPLRGIRRELEWVRPS